MPEEEDPYIEEHAEGNFLHFHQKYCMASGIHIMIHDLVWKNMKEEFPVVMISESIKALPPVAHDDELEMEFRNREQSEPRWGTNILAEPVEAPEQIGIEDIKPDGKEIKAARQLLILKGQKAMAYDKRYTKLHQEVL